MPIRDVKLDQKSSVKINSVEKNLMHIHNKNKFFENTKLKNG